MEEDEHTVRAGREILQRHFSDLRESAIEPAALAAELLARGMISTQDEWDSRQTTVNPANRRAALVSLVMTQIASKRLGAFEDFLQALAKEPQNKPIFDKLIREYEANYSNAKKLSTETKGHSQQQEAATSSSRPIGRLGETVKLGDLACFKYKEGGKTKRLYVNEEMAPRWKDVGKALKFTPSELQNIAITNHHDPAECCDSLMTKWISGFVSQREKQPLTWATLLEAMEDSRLGDLAETLESLLKQ